MNKQQLATKIWESANKMRSKIEANEYKDYILGFIFYKYLSDKEVKWLKDNDFTDDQIKSLTEEDVETVEEIQESLGYFIAYNDLFSTWLEMGKDFDVSNVRDALSAFSRLINTSHKKVFERIFDTLQTGLSKLGENAASQTKSISELIQLIKDIPMDAKQDYDVLGFIYEYLIGMFAANAGKKAGEFYTPHEVSLLMSEIVADHLKDKDTIRIYDPTSGSGSLLINIGRSVAKHIAKENKIQYYAQELKQNTYNLTRMNLIMRGISPDNVFTRNGDTLEEDWPFFDESDPISTYNPLYVDAVVSNPPYSQPWDSANKETDPRYARFGLAPKTKADYAFLLHDLYHIKPDGIMTIVLPHGVLFRGGEEGEIRKNLIEGNHIDAIIGLPANIFFGTGIPTIVMVLRQKREKTDVLIVDASKGFVKVGKNNKLRASDIKKMADTVINRQGIEKYSKVVAREEIRKNEYNLNIPRYVDSSNTAETWDIYASMFGGIPNTEIDELHDFWTALPDLRKDLFTALSSHYSQVAVEDVKKAIRQHPNTQAFIGLFNQSFSDFHSYLKKELLNEMTSINTSKEEAVLSEALFKRLEPIALIDKYEAYQLLDDDWTNISIDLEIIQTEGFAATKTVDPNMVIKKKDGKDHEVQEGWVGHVLPFELVQETLLEHQLKHLKETENRLLEIASEYTEIIDSLSEEEKESSVLNDANDAFVTKEVTKKAKEIMADAKASKQSLPKYTCADDSFESKIVHVSKRIEEEKELKKQIKKESAELHRLTKETIESLSDEQVLALLEEKWIKPLVEGINKLPETIIGDLATKIQALSEKYASTYADIEADISETETQLATLMGELEGDEFDRQGLDEFKALLVGA
jgi:type I restriction enzyme M protein